MENQTTITEFILLGFSENRNVEILLFLLFFVVYFVTVTGNLLIIIITLIDFHLQTPMYFFLRNYAILEIGYTSAVVPRALIHLATGNKKISYAGCMAQLFWYFFLGTTDFFLLTVMSLDRYVAICHPLRYTTIMNPHCCMLLVLTAWAVGFFLIFSQTMNLIQFPFCGSHVINHFFCDSSPLHKLLCGDIQLFELLNFLSASCSLLGSLVITIISYAMIITTVLRIPTAAGRQKAFSTCAAHITIASVTYGSCIAMYVKPMQDDEQSFNKVVAVITNVMCPLMTPFVYSLRNKQVKNALNNVFNCKTVTGKMQIISWSLKGESK